MTPNAERDAYIATLEEENARMKKSLEFALARKQTFADELFEVTMRFRNFRETVAQAMDGMAKLGQEAVRMARESR